MFWFTKKVSVKESELGVIDDPRPIFERKKDYMSDEIIGMGAPFEWEEKSEFEWNKFPIFNQVNSSSCVGQAVSKLLGIENWLEEKKFIHCSARDVYTRRSNFPGKGMYFINGLSIGAEGVTLEQLMPSQELGEADMNKFGDKTHIDELIGNIGRGGRYFSVVNDIDKFASIIEPRGKGILIGVKFGSGEWSKEVPTITSNNPKYGHGIVGTNATLYKGKKAIVIEDSWGIDSGINGRRILTEDWFEAGRIIFGGHYEHLDNGGLEERPTHNFDRNLYYGLNDDEDVRNLQECLAYLKLFPNNVDFTGNFYGITLKAVKNFQGLNGITPAMGYVGPITRKLLNQLF